MNNYIVKSGETLTDCVLNATGNIQNLDLILESNNFTTWTPQLTPGQVLIIPDSIIPDLNNIRELSIYPAVNNFNPNVYTKADYVVSLLYNVWILATGRWNDSGMWRDDCLWID